MAFSVIIYNFYYILIHLEISGKDCKFHLNLRLRAKVNWCFYFDLKKPHIVTMMFLVSGWFSIQLVSVSSNFNSILRGRRPLLWLASAHFRTGTIENNKSVKDGEVTQEIDNMCTPAHLGLVAQLRIKTILFFNFVRDSSRSWRPRTQSLNSWNQIFDSDFCSQLAVTLHGWDQPRL